MPEKLSHGPRAGYDASRVGAGLSRGPSLKKKLTAAPWSNTFPAPQATLDLDFSNDRGFVRGVGQGRSMDAVTFTRASSANWVDSNGVLRTGAGSFTGSANALGVNLLGFPQDFDNAAWGKSNTTVVGNAENAPDGTLTAERLTPNTNNTTHYVARVGYITVTANTNITNSVYVKASGYSFVTISLSGSSTAWVSITADLSLGTITQTGNGAAGTYVGSAISDVGNGWYRISVTGSTTSTNADLIISISTTGTPTYTTFGLSPSFVGNSELGIYIWGAQIEVGSTATTYYPTNINVPRFDWASTAQINRPNICLYTEDLGSNWWLKEANTTITTDQTTAPDGTNTADLVTVSADTGNRFHSSTGVPLGPALAPIANATYTLSAYVKAGTATALRASFPNTQNGPFFDFATATWDTSSGWTTSVQDVGSGWYRISATRAVNNNFTRFGFYVFGASYPSDCYFWGLQVELGDTATLYIANGALIPANTTLAANPTCNGLLIEESRANRLLWCRDATNAAWTKTDVTAAKDQTGIDGVASAASSLTASADGGTCIQTITLASGSRTGSVYLKRITGTGNVQVTLDGSTWSTVDLSSTEWRRIVLSGTVTNPTVGIRLATNGDAVAMDYGQIEDGASVTTPILTTSASVTRSADSMTMNTTPWHNLNGGTFYVEARDVIGTQVNSTLLRVASTTGGTTPSYGIFIRNILGRYSAFSTSNSTGSNVNSNDTFVDASTTNPKLALSVLPSQFLFSANGQSTVVRNFNSVDSLSPNQVLTLQLTDGPGSGVRSVKHTFTRLWYVPKALSADAILGLTR